MAEPIERADDVSATVGGAEWLGDQDVIGTESALPEVICPDRPSTAVDQEAAIGVGDMQSFSLPDIDAALRCARGSPCELDRRSLTVGSRLRRGATSNEDSQQEDFVLHRLILLQVAQLRKRIPLSLGAGLAVNGSNSWEHSNWRKPSNQSVV